MVPLYVGDSGEHEAFVISEPKMWAFDSSENLLNILQSFRDCHCSHLTGLAIYPMPGNNAAPKIDFTDPRK